MILIGSKNCTKMKAVYTSQCAQNSAQICPRYPANVCKCMNVHPIYLINDCIQAKQLDQLQTYKVFLYSDHYASFWSFYLTKPLYHILLVFSKITHFPNVLRFYWGVPILQMSEIDLFSWRKMEI